MTRLAHLLIVLFVYLNVKVVSCCQKAVQKPKVVHPTTTTPSPASSSSSTSESTTAAPNSNKELATLLEDDVYGQHLAVKTVYASLKSHLMSKSPSKALVLSFHGSSGTGKTHLTKIIANSLFKNGVESPFFHIFLGSSFDVGENEIDEAKASIVKQIRDSVKVCPRSIFVFDEVDSMSPKLIDVILPFVEYHDSVEGVDFRKATFIFLSNHGGREINDLVIEHVDRGGIRETLQLHSFEKSITNAVYNRKGGLHRSVLIEKGLIDLFVPFLPLEKRHTSMCVRDYLKLTKRVNEAQDSSLVNNIVDSLQYFKEVYSSTGCKKVAVRSEIVLNEENENDEL